MHSSPERADIWARAEPLFGGRREPRIIDVLMVALALLLVALGVALVTRRSGHPYTIALVIWGLVLSVFGALDPLGLSLQLDRLRRPS